MWKFNIVNILFRCFIFVSRGEISWAKVTWKISLKRQWLFWKLCSFVCKELLLETFSTSDNFLLQILGLIPGYNSKLLSSYIIKLFFLFNNHILDYFFHWWLVYKQLALGWKNFKQLSGFNPLSLSNNINYWLKKSEVFSFVINVK